MSRRDPDDVGRHPHVRVDFVAHAGELVEARHGPSVAGDREATANLERRRITPRQRCGSVRHPEVGAVVAEAPALPVVAEAPDGLERVAVVDVRHTLTVGQLDEAILNERQALSELVRRQRS